MRDKQEISSHCHFRSDPTSVSFTYTDTVLLHRKIPNHERLKNLQRVREEQRPSCINLLLLDRSRWVAFLFPFTPRRTIINPGIDCCIILFVSVPFLQCTHALYMVFTKLLKDKAKLALLRLLQTHLALIKYIGTEWKIALAFDPSHALNYIYKLYFHLFFSACKPVAIWGFSWCSGWTWFPPPLIP